MNGGQLAIYLWSANQRQNNFSKFNTQPYPYMYDQFYQTYAAENVLGCDPTSESRYGSGSRASVGSQV